MLQAYNSRDVTKLLSGSTGNSLSTYNNARSGKAAYIWISPNPAKAGPTLVVVVDKNLPFVPNPNPIPIKIKNCASARLPL